ncbi:MAG: formylmethanofuran--tetrahydromethanopterin N-formyltransferase [Gemmatimonadota bacterium]|nr:formylmethanofuran--tetrahydromethanopterin N-formyltransferase [Gemmatimonadota bacterium]MDH5284365.1 formylmethanofuran--tetrahydromethanopterin N-formyltransferase [Gemmatimonadota bacterium]
MRIGNTEIADTFAEAFAMVGARLLITAETAEWALAAGRSVTGFATSIIGCKCEAGIEATMAPDDTPDGRPGVSVLIFAMNEEGLGKRLVERVGQCVMTCPSTACYNGLVADKEVVVGGQLRFFGDKFQIAKLLEGRRMWRVPVMDGEFLVDDRFGIQPAVGGGNFLMLGRDQRSTLAAAGAAVAAMGGTAGAILPFPGGVVRSGSKPSSRYKFLHASTNDAYCPTLRAIAARTDVPDGVGAVLEIVIDGLDLSAVEAAMRRGIHAAAAAGALGISAGNYGGGLGQYQIHLHPLLAGAEEARA